MNLAPLMEAASPIPLHAVAALAAFVIGLIQFLRAKGTASHRALGYVWAAFMMTVALSSFAINSIRQLGPFSWIHLLSIHVAVMLPYIILQARRGNIEAHRRGMITMFIGALVIAGVFTLLPGRVMHQVVFGL